MDLEQVWRRRSWLGAEDRSLSGSGDSGAGNLLRDGGAGQSSEMRRWFEIRDGVAGPGLGEDGADQQNMTRRDMEAAVLARARRKQSWPRLGDDGSDASRTIGSQITPKTFLRCLNYGDSFAFDFEKTAWYFDSHFTRFFQPFLLLSHQRPLVLFYFIKLFVAHQPSEGPWFMGPSLILPPSPPSHHLKIAPTPLRRHGRLTSRRLLQRCEVEPCVTLGTYRVRKSYSMSLKEYVFGMFVAYSLVVAYQAVVTYQADRDANRRENHEPTHLRTTGIVQSCTTGIG